MLNMNNVNDEPIINMSNSIIGDSSRLAIPLGLEQRGNEVEDHTLKKNSTVRTTVMTTSSQYSTCSKLESIEISKIGKKQIKNFANVENHLKLPIGTKRDNTIQVTINKLKMT